MLKKRLQTLASLITEDNLIDIGTDHGYLIIDLLQNRRIKRAMAVEITKGPLDNVKTNVVHSNTKNVEFYLSDGLRAIKSNVISDYDAISICGMGGALISKILTDSHNKLCGKTLYLQPNNGSDKLRKTLNELGFAIIEEKVVIENNVYYEIIKARESKQKLSQKECYFGPINIINCEKNFIDKYIEKKNHLLKINKQLIENNVYNSYINEQIKMIEELFDEVT